MNWRAIELVADYWIIQDIDGYTEYTDSVGDNLMFFTREQAENFINSLKENKQ